MRILTAAVSHPGLVRQENQDICLVGEPTGAARLAVVCDGMGGVAGGRIAASVAGEAFLRHFGEACAAGLPRAEDDLHRVFSGAVYHANTAVFERSVATPELAGMGTTLAAALVADGRVTAINIGDSRVYHYRDGSLTRLSHDDSYVQTLVDEGTIRPDEAGDRPDRNLLTAALGIAPYVEFHFAATALLPGDRILLCSDGLTGHCSDERIAGLLAATPPAAGAARGSTPADATVKALVDEACRCGGEDNITVVLLDVLP